MNDMVKIFEPQSASTVFDQIRISIASPEKIRSWSYSEVKKPETINYRTFKPEKDGLFCARVFGPVKDYECLCGKYRRMKYKGIVCEKCGVEVTLSKVRRERMGHIELVAPVAHIWFLKSLPSRISQFLDIPLKDLDKILYFENYMVLDPGLTPLKKGSLLTEDQYLALSEEHGDESFEVGIGAEVVQKLLSDIDLLELKVELRLELTTTDSETRRKKIIKRLQLVEAFLESGARPEWMILTVLPVIPPDLRPLVPLDGGRFATADLNDLYRRVINRNNRLKRLIELQAPDIIVRNEKRMLQESVDALFDNGRREKRVISGSNKRPLKSLSDMLKGKQGRFRQNLLGKRVDYSGRSVIVVGAELRLHQCGLPKKMALELFKPFVYAKLELYGYVPTIRAAKRMVEKEKPEVWDLLEEVILEHPVLLNRAPTLHRLGIQAFEPVLIEGKAIQLHPLVCAAFNADFDGDQMAVHVPLSLEAQLETRVLIMATNNILSPASGKPIIVPTQDMVLGIYYMTYENTCLAPVSGKYMLISSLQELEHALHAKILHLHSRIKCRIPVYEENAEVSYKTFETTAGRVVFYSYLPKHPRMTFSLVDRVMKKKDISDLIDIIYRHCGQKQTVFFCDRIMVRGFQEAARAGISFGKNDLVIPSQKVELIRQAEDQVKKLEQQYQSGLITQSEKYNKVVDMWAKCTDNVADAMMDVISHLDPQGQENSVFMMANSGARGSSSQMKQLAGMRGLMAKPSGEIIEKPIVSNFKEGLSVMEYFNSTHGARKGLADTALKTANSGYLTRRLVDVAQDAIITEQDCGTEQYFTVAPIVEGGREIVSLADMCLGRVIAQDLLEPGTNKVLIAKGELIDEETVEFIALHDLSVVRVRSPLLCELDFGICAKCYGRDLSGSDLVSVGEAVGVIAAQSIGEPGTQLTMRTFHVGGAAQKGAEQSSIEAVFKSKIRFVDVEVVKDLNDLNVVVSRNGEVLQLDNKGNERLCYRVPYGAKLFVEDGQDVDKGEKIAEWDPYNIPIISAVTGYIRFVGLVEGISYRGVVDEVTGIASYVVIDAKKSASKALETRPSIEIIDDQGVPLTLSTGREARYFVEPETILSVVTGQKVLAGDLLARVPREGSKTKDITGGLPRVAELFEARKPKDHAFIADADGIIEYGKDYKGRRRIYLRPKNSDEPIEYVIPKGKRVIVQEGDFVRKGYQLVDGKPSPYDILKVFGVEALTKYLAKEIQDVYRMQGVKINDKHIEIIVRQMLKKLEIIDAGDSVHLVGDIIDVAEFKEINQKLKAQNKNLIKGEVVLQGITKASLQTQSFISAASFQETTRVLTEAAIIGKTDRLKGLKENVIVGCLIPAGTGISFNRVQLLAAKKRKLELDKGAGQELLPDS